MMGLGKLLCLPIMTSHAILGSDEGRDEKAFVVVGVLFAFFGSVTFDAADPFRRVAAHFPIIDAADPHVLGGMAIDAFLVFGRDEWTETAASPLLHLNVADPRQRQKEDQAEPADHVTGEVLLAVA